MSAVVVEEGAHGAAGLCNCTHAKRAQEAEGVDAIGEFICCQLNCVLNRPGDTPIAFLAENRVVVRIHNSLTSAERHLTLAQDDRSLFYRYLKELTRQIQHDIVRQVQNTLRQPVRDVHLDIDYAVGTLVFVVELGKREE
jgi:uncharacterized protein YbcI